MKLKMFKISLGISIFFSFSAWAKPVGIIFAAFDHELSGCAYDPESPNSNIQVRVVSEPGALKPASEGMIGIAGYGCPWTGAPQYQGHGFTIQYRRPVNSVSDIQKIQVVLYGANPEEKTILLTSTPQTSIEVKFNRPSETFLYHTEDYTMGISRSWGAAVSEFYNNRVDPTLNLIHADPGAMLQTAYFGDADRPVFATRASPAPALLDCQQGTASDTTRWNPTQSGSACGINIGSSADMCTSSRSNTLCKESTLAVAEPNDANPDWIQYRVHFRNWFYPFDQSGTYQYQSYDNLYSWVKYTFKRGVVEVDYQSWLSDDQLFGVPGLPTRIYQPSFQQLPVAFLAQMTAYSSGSQSITRNALNKLDYAGAPNEGQINLQTNFPPYDLPNVAPISRWVLAKSVNNRPSVPVMTPGDFLTIGLYGGPVTGPNGYCPQRFIQMGFGGMNATWNAAGQPTPDISSTPDANQISSVQSLVYATPAGGSFMSGRIALSSYLPTELIPGKSSRVGALMNSFESQGGYMPADECNPPR
jgi:hypothetical protein